MGLLPSLLLWIPPLRHSLAACCKFLNPQRFGRLLTLTTGTSFFTGRSCLLVDSISNTLSNILLYHVVGGAAVFSSELTDGQHITTLETSNVTVTINQNAVLDKIKINEAIVVEENVNASNGVIHAIDAVLVPPALDLVVYLQECEVGIPQVASENGDFSTLVAALTVAGLDETLASPKGPFTVFAPVDSAFEAFPPGFV
mmetsp:Transcript_14123/g.30774  ORF Transcript_14123/g.30774 Transcript_14123/m.30774 type:complete len:200 (-) Transcript_14123:1220-1819(-)